MIAVVWSLSAIDDLVGIRSYISQFNPNAAEDIARRLIDVGNSLKSFPNRGRLGGDGLRELTLVFPTIIRYEIIGDEAHILGVRHGMREQPP